MFYFTHQSSKEQLMIDLSFTTKDFSAELESILSRVYRQELRILCQYFTCQLAFKKEELKRLLLNNPNLLRYSLAKFQDNVDFLTKDCELDNATVQKMIRLQPLLLVHSVENKLKPVISFIRNDLQMVSWKRILARYPQVLSLPASTLKAKV